MSKEQNVLLLGILSLVGVGVLGPIAWIRGNQVLYAIDVQGYPSTERNLAIAGRICGMIGTLGLLTALLMLALLVSGHIAGRHF